jgi:hypothetical protein
MFSATVLQPAPSAGAINRLAAASVASFSARTCV